LAPRQQRLKVALPSPRLALPTLIGQRSQEFHLRAVIQANQAHKSTTELGLVAPPTGTVNVSTASTRARTSGLRMRSRTQTTLERAGEPAQRHLGGSEVTS